MVCLDTQHACRSFSLTDIPTPGKSTALEFARTSPSALKLILTARRLEALEQLAAQIKSEVGDGVKVLPVRLDVSDADDVAAFMGRLPEEFKNVDVLINNA